MLKQKIAAGVLGLAMVLPMMASADTLTDSQNQIQTLLAQIKALQEQIRTIISSNTGMMPGHKDDNSTTTQDGARNGNGPCFMPMRGFGMGARGDDVKGLQKMLRGEEASEFQGEATGFFGSQTAKALGRWQKHHGIASSTVGSMGPRTQEFLKKRCGGEDENDKDHDKKDGMMMHMPAHITGSITAISGNDITVTNGDGKTVVVHITATTTIKAWSGTSTAPTTGTLSDLTSGKRIAADGPKNADGSINAVHVMVGDKLPMMSHDNDDNDARNMGGHGDNNKGKDNYTHGSMSDMMGGHGDR